MIILNKYHKTLNFLIGEKRYSIGPREIKDVPDELSNKILSNKYIYKVQMKPLINNKKI